MATEVGFRESAACRLVNVHADEVDVRFSAAQLPEEPADQFQVRPCFPNCTQPDTPVPVPLSLGQKLHRSTLQVEKLIQQALTASLFPFLCDFL